MGRLTETYTLPSLILCNDTSQRQFIYLSKKAQRTETSRKAKEQMMLSWIRRWVRIECQIACPIGLLWLEEFSEMVSRESHHRDNRLVWANRLNSDVGFWFFDIGSFCRCDVELTKRGQRSGVLLEILLKVYYLYTLDIWQFLYVPRINISLGFEVPNIFIMIH